MNLLHSLKRLIKGRHSFFDEEWNDCFSILKKSLIRFKEDDRGASLIKQLNDWNKLEVKHKEEQFPSIYLTTKAFLGRKAKLPELFEESFNDRIIEATGSHLQKEKISLLFGKEEDQKVLLSKYFILDILINAKEILGNVSNSLLSKCIDFCEAIPTIDYSLLDGLDLHTIKNENHSIVLRDFSHQLAEHLSNSFGDKRISKLYKESHVKMSTQYGLLNTFPFVLDLIPEKYLKFEDINTLDNAYLRDALKKTVDQLTEKNEEIKKKNQELERTEQKLKKLTDRLLIINEIDRTTLMSDSLSDFIYGTLDVLQTRLNLTNSKLLFFDFEKKFYSEHILSEGKCTVKQNLLNSFRGDLDKLQNSEYDMVPSDITSANNRYFYPILEQGKLIASISFEKKQTMNLGSDFINTIDEVTDGMAVSIVNKKLEEELKKRNKDMTDSLYYAQRIQKALIPSFDNFTKLFTDNFVFFKPKDLVSGDFYWAHRTFDNRKIWITADCTGHGVPGAIMSVIGFNILNKVVIEKGIWESDLILNELRREIISTLTQKGDDQQAKDGMDISICIYNPNRGTLQYSGALNSIFVIRNLEGKLGNPKSDRIKVHSEHLMELLPDKMPAAYFEGISKPFTKITIPVQKGDNIYTFSDGYADQFGGEKDKKFMIKNFRALLSSISHLPMREQVVLVEEAFDNWKRDSEQIDDVCVIGVKIEEALEFDDDF